MPAKGKAVGNRRWSEAFMPQCRCDSWKGVGTEGGLGRKGLGPKTDLPRLQWNPGALVIHGGSPSIHMNGPALVWPPDQPLAGSSLWEARPQWECGGGSIEATAVAVSHFCSLQIWAAHFHDGDSNWQTEGWPHPKDTEPKAVVAKSVTLMQGEGAGPWTPWITLHTHVQTHIAVNPHVYWMHSHSKFHRNRFTSKYVNFPWSHPWLHYCSHHTSSTSFLLKICHV